MMKGATLNVGIAGLSLGEVFIEDLDGVSICLDLPKGTPAKKANAIMAERVVVVCLDLEAMLEGTGPSKKEDPAHTVALDFALAVLVEFVDRGWVKTPSKRKRVVAATRKDVCDWVKVLWERHADSIRLPMALMYTRAELQAGARVVESILQR